MNTNRPLLLLLLLVLTLGCGKSKEVTFDPIEQVSMLVANLPDSARKPAQFESYFVAGAAPAIKDRVKYGKVMLSAVKAKQVDKTATIDVQVRDVNGAPLGEVQWTAVMEADGWKLQNAPLP